MFHLFSFFCSNQHQINIILNFIVISACILGDARDRSKTGQLINGQGTGIVVSTGYTFNADGTSAEEGSEIVIEIIQLKWDGHSVSVTKREICDQLLSYKLLGDPISYFLLDDDSFIAPFLTTQGIVAFRFKFHGSEWVVVESGDPFMTCRQQVNFALPGEFEPSMAKVGEKYLMYTRGNDPKGRIYCSEDGLNYKLLFDRCNNTVPQVLNTGLDGSLYLTTNPNMDMLRNPLVAFPMLDEDFGESVVIHDEQGIRDAKGDKIPFIDHGVGVNLYLEGRWRHFLWYRVCDLKERSLHSSQESICKEIHGESGPKERSSTGGLYMVELEYDRTANLPFSW